MSTDAIVYPVLFITLGFVLWVLISEMQRRSRLRLMIDFKLRLLDRLKSTEDIGVLLQQSDDGVGARIHERVIGATQTGVVLLSISAGFFVLAWLNSFQARPALFAFAVMAASVGAGFVLSAALARRLALHADPTENATQTEVRER